VEKVAKLAVKKAGEFDGKPMSGLQWSSFLQGGVAAKVPAKKAAVKKSVVKKAATKKVAAKKVVAKKVAAKKSAK
jgi:hypothetical protein